MDADARRIIWNQFILAQALARIARGMTEPEDGDSIPFCYTDTHAGPGRIAAPQPFLDAVLAQRDRFSGGDFFAALTPFTPAEAPPPPRDRHPGSWILAGRVLAAIDRPRLAIEMDINDIDADVISQAQANREAGWLRFWSHDWFLFLRSRLAMVNRPNFVFIDPPPDDARGPAYAIDAAILLDTMALPYMVSYPVHSPQDPIDQIGRTGIELDCPSGGHGVLLGGGAEGVLLHLLPDLRRLAAILGGELTIRLPKNIDYSI